MTKVHLIATLHTFIERRSAAASLATCICPPNPGVLCAKDGPRARGGIRWRFESAFGVARAVFCMGDDNLAGLGNGSAPVGPDTRPRQANNGLDAACEPM